MEQSSCVRDYAHPSNLNIIRTHCDPFHVCVYVGDVQVGGLNSIRVLSLTFFFARNLSFFCAATMPCLTLLTPVGFCVCVCVFVLPCKICYMCIPHCVRMFCGTFSVSFCWCWLPHCQPWHYPPSITPNAQRSYVYICGKVAHKIRIRTARKVCLSVWVDVWVSG